MEFRVLGSFGGDSPDCRMTSFLIDGVVAVDAGAITRALTIEEQRQVRHVLITHTHMDHTNTLPFLIENSFGSSDQPVSIFCTKRVLAGVRRHLFNNLLWPDFTVFAHLGDQFIEQRLDVLFVFFDEQLLEQADLEKADRRSKKHGIFGEVAKKAGPPDE